MIIDISRYQGKIDWKIVKSSNTGITGAFIKASEGVGCTDPNLKYNALEASKNGFKVGYYHFASLNNHDEVKDAKEEVKYFISIIKDLPLTMPLALDIEENKSKLDKDEVLNYIKTFINELELSGYKDYVLYSYSPFLNENLPEKHDLGKYRLWVADYNEPLVLPKGWSKQWLWQYTQQGVIKGIVGKVDLNK